MSRKLLSWLSCAAFIVAAGCADLQVQNLNNPDTQRVLSLPDDLKSVTAGAFVNMYSAWGNNLNAYYCNTNMEWTGDYITMTNNVRAWWSIFKIEPRAQFNNTLAFADLDAIGLPFRRWNSTISSANDVLKAIEKEGKKIGPNGSETEMVRAAAYFVKAMTLGYVATTFDKGYIVNYDTDVQKIIPLSTYKEVMAEALKNFDIAIDLASKNTFTLPANFINTPAPMKNTDLERLARTYAANFMAQNARTRAENAQTDWQRVLRYVAADKLMTQDYIINLDGANWRNGIISIAGLDWYWRADHRIIRHMDPTYPKRFPVDATSFRKATSDDARLDLYFKYESGLSFFRPDRGPQLRSHYRFARYDALYNANSLGPAPFLYAETSKLLRAEALAMTNDLAGAISILNASRRKTIGKLPDIPATATQAEVLDAIFKERDLELMLTDYGIHFKDMRRRDMLQKGTVLHFPVPADELGTISVPLYTFGGATPQSPGGTADGSNAWYTP
jgi:starch-binding outer membrane protein, SusD/RagB family